MKPTRMLAAFLAAASSFIGIGGAAAPIAMHAPASGGKAIAPDRMIRLAPQLYDLEMTVRAGTTPQPWRHLNQRQRRIRARRKHSAGFKHAFAR